MGLFTPPINECHVRLSHVNEHTVGGIKIIREDILIFATNGPFGLREGKGE